MNTNQGTRRYKINVNTLKQVNRGGEEKDPSLNDRQVEKKTDSKKQRTSLQHKSSNGNPYC